MFVRSVCLTEFSGTVFQTAKGATVTKNYEVVPSAKGGWDVVADSGKRASAHHSTQSAAAGDAKRLATSAGGGEVRIHGRDGKIRSSATIGKNDPFPPRG
jgi:Uncharacterized protein conserved in bacteria (DUF2188)